MSAHWIIVVVGDEDFQKLCEDSAEWREWRDFQDADCSRLEGKRQYPTRGWKRIYWLGENYASVILARSFLAAEGFDCEILFDAAEHPNGESLGWVILTDYEAAGDAR